MCVVEIAHRWRPWSRRVFRRGRGDDDDDWLMEAGIVDAFKSNREMNGIGVMECVRVLYRKRRRAAHLIVLALLANLITMISNHKVQMGEDCSTRTGAGPPWCGCDGVMCTSNSGWWLPTADTHHHHHIQWTESNHGSVLLFGWAHAVSRCIIAITELVTLVRLFEWGSHLPEEEGLCTCMGLCDLN